MSHWTRIQCLRRHGRFRSRLPAPAPPELQTPGSSLRNQPRCRLEYQSHHCRCRGCRRTLQPKPNSKRACRVRQLRGFDRIFRFPMGQPPRAKTELGDPSSICALAHFILIVLLWCCLTSKMLAHAQFSTFSTGSRTSQGTFSNSLCNHS